MKTRLRACTPHTPPGGAAAWTQVPVGARGRVAGRAGRSWPVLLRNPLR